jgi:hypothetical protein
MDPPGAGIGLPNKPPAGAGAPDPNNPPPVLDPNILPPGGVGDPNAEPPNAGAGGAPKAGAGVAPNAGAGDAVVPPNPLVLPVGAGAPNVGAATGGAEVKVCTVLAPQEIVMVKCCFVKSINDLMHGPSKTSVLRLCMCGLERVSFLTTRSVSKKTITSIILIILTIYLI